MPHADSASIPKSIQSKADLWRFTYMQLQGLLDGQRNWVTNLSNSASLIYHTLGDSPLHTSKPSNWVGFYIRSSLYPTPRVLQQPIKSVQTVDMLLLGPFCGKPACQSISITPGKARGVCADAFIAKETLLVPNVDEYPGHIACDGDTRSELVIPLVLRLDGEDHVVGVLDLDNIALSGFDEEDRVGLEKIAELIVTACDW